MEQSVANLVDMRDVSFTRGNRCIFDNISLTVPRGKITAIMGPSGIGKTTLLRLIGGQIAPDHGEILFDGENIPAMSRSRLYTVRKRMSMLFQSGALFTDMNVFDNVAYPLREHTQLPAPLLHSTVMMKLEAVGLRGAAKLMPSELSGGITLFELFERKLEMHQGHLVKAAVELAKDWRTDRMLRKLEALLAVADETASLIITGNGDVVQPENDLIAIGSGGPYAQAAARALLENTELSAREIAEKALDIAGDICIYTNHFHTIEELSYKA